VIRETKFKLSNRQQTINLEKPLTHGNSINVDVGKVFSHLVYLIKIEFKDGHQKNSQFWEIL
jgi:hypothetical protein